MRSVELRTVEIGAVAGNNVPPLRFSEAIKAISEIKEGGMRIAELRQCLRVADAVDAAVATGKDHVLLEEQDWMYLCGRVDAHVFPFAFKAFADLADAIARAETVNPNAASEGV